MTAIWGIQGKYAKGKGEGAKKFLKFSLVGIGWPNLGDLSRIPPNFDSFRDKVDHASPATSDWKASERKSWISRSAGVTFRFVHEMRNGDFIFLPTTRLDNCINIGVISGPYKHDPSFDPEYTHLRPVRWVHRVKRDALSKASKEATMIASSFCRIHEVPDELRKFLNEK